MIRKTAGPLASRRIEVITDNSSMEEREMIQRWAETWKQAGPVLDAVRRKEIQQADNLKVLATLEQAFNHALRQMPPRPSSGMVEMQKWLAKLRR